MRLKPLGEQVVVITGASSGIGLATARMAAKQGAKLVLAARNESGLRELADEINARGGEALAVVTDVGVEAEVEALGLAATNRFGGFDTWINNAGTSIFGDMLKIPTEDSRKLFETNFWGVVYGSLVAARHLRTRPGGGTLINLGSVLSDRAIPVQGMYSATKHAVKGFTDALRMELEAADAPVSVTLVKPSAIDTPYAKRSRNWMEEEPTLPPPVYAPDVVARTILHCAEHSEREVTVGGGGKMLAGLGHWAPRIVDWVMEATMIQAEKKGPRKSNPAGTLYEPAHGLEERGQYEGHVMESSLYTAARLHPGLTALAVVGVGAVLAGAALAAVSTPSKTAPWPVWRRS
jgi:short-subunit dehydrogenase